jgi:hypothetical protein
LSTLLTVIKLVSYSYSKIIHPERSIYCTWPSDWICRQDKARFYLYNLKTHRCTKGHGKFTFYINTNRHLIYAIQHHKLINK